MSSAIHTDLFLAHPPAAVWRALTDRELLAQWLMANDFSPQVGHRFTFRTAPVPDQGFDGIVHCEVLVLDAPRLLRISWTARPRLDTTVTWRLEPEGRGTRLFLAHEGFDDDDPQQQTVRRILGGGWRGQLAERIARTLAELDHRG